MSNTEHAWDDLRRRIYRRNDIANLFQLETALHLEWTKIPQAVFQNLILSMRRRIVACINAQDGHTRY